MSFGICVNQHIRSARTAAQQHATPSSTFTQTVQNITKYSTDFSAGIKESQNFDHDFFAGLQTRSFDPTLVDGFKQLSSLDNKHIMCIYSLPKKVLQDLIRNLLVPSCLMMEPVQQGSWKDDIPGFSEMDGVRNCDNHVAQSLPGRFQWKMDTYFHKQFNELFANQDISLRYLQSWSGQSDVFTDELMSKFYFAASRAILCAASREGR